MLLSLKVCLIATLESCLTISSITALVLYYLSLSLSGLIYIGKRTEKVKFIVALFQLTPNGKTMSIGNKMEKIHYGIFTVIIIQQ